MQGTILTGEKVIANRENHILLLSKTGIPTLRTVASVGTVKEFAYRSKVAEGIIRATAEWPSSTAIRGLVGEYLSENSEERRVAILLDVLDCLRQDLDAADAEPNDSRH